MYHLYHHWIILDNSKLIIVFYILALIMSSLVPKWISLIAMDCQLYDKNHCIAQCIVTRIIIISFIISLLVRSLRVIHPRSWSSSAPPLITHHNRPKPHPDNLMGTIFVTIMIIVTIMTIIVIFATIILPLITLDPKLHQEQKAMTLILMMRLGVIHILRNHFWGSRQTPPPLCNL